MAAFFGIALFGLIGMCRAAKQCLGAPSSFAQVYAMGRGDSGVQHFGWQNKADFAGTNCSGGVCYHSDCCERDTAKCISHVGSAAEQACTINGTQFWDWRASGNTTADCCAPKQRCTSSVLCESGYRIKEASVLRTQYCIGPCLAGTTTNQFGSTQNCCEEDQTKCLYFQTRGTGCEAPYEPDTALAGYTGNTQAACCRPRSTMAPTVAPTPSPTTPPTAGTRSPTPSPTAGTRSPTPSPTSAPTPAPTAVVSCATYEEPVPPTPAPGVITSAGQHCTTIGSMTLLVLATLFGY